MPNKDNFITALKVLASLNKANQSDPSDGLPQSEAVQNVRAEHRQSTVLWAMMACFFLLPLFFLTGGSIHWACFMAFCGVVHCWLGFRMIRYYFAKADAYVASGELSYEIAELNKLSAWRIMGCVSLVAQTDYSLAMYVIARHQGVQATFVHWSNALPIFLPVILGFIAASRLKALQNPGLSAATAVLLTSANCITCGYVLLIGFIWGNPALRCAASIFRDYSLSDWWPFSPTRMDAAFQLYHLIGTSAFHMMFLWIPVLWIAFNLLSAAKTLLFRRPRPLPGMASLVCFGILFIAASVLSRTGELADATYYHSSYVKVDPLEVKWHDCTEQFAGQPERAQDVCFAQADKDWAQRIATDKNKAWQTVEHNPAQKTAYLKNDKNWKDIGDFIVRIDRQHATDTDKHYHAQTLYMNNDETYAHNLEAAYGH